MSHTHKFGKPVNVFKYNAQTSKAEIASGELSEIFSRDELKNRLAVIVSLVGAFRKGKSFFLDNCLRYMYGNYKSINNPEGPLEGPWMGDPEEPLLGFSWRHGTERETTGVIFWSDVFLHTDRATGSKLAIFLMDTQGLFDTKSTPEENSRIFALGTLISSIQVLNIFSNIQEDQLQYLQFATEFTKMVVRDKRSRSGTTFQNLIFLLRDWKFDAEFSFGYEGGKQYLQSILEQHPNQKECLKTVREHIRGSFKDIKCCLLPDPGKAVTRKSDYDGRWSVMDEEFRDELIVAIETLLKPENLVAKKINDNSVLVEDMKGFIETYFEMFQSPDLPQTETLYEAMVEKELRNLVDKIVKEYKLKVYRVRYLLTYDNLHIMHEHCLNACRLEFRDGIKVAGKCHEEKYEEMLVTQLDELYQEWSSREQKTFEEIEVERKKAEQAIAEQKQQEYELRRAEQAARDALHELEKNRLENQLKDQAYEHEKEIAESRLEAEQERVRKMEMEHQKEEALRRRLELEAENSELREEAGKKKKFCSIM